MTAKNNTSGHTGVHYDSANDRWKAHIVAEGVRISLGQHMHFEDAVIARKKGVKLHGRKDYPYS